MKRKFLDGNNGRAFFCFENYYGWRIYVKNLSRHFIAPDVLAVVFFINSPLLYGRNWVGGKYARPHLSRQIQSSSCTTLLDDSRFVARSFVYNENIAVLSTCKRRDDRFSAQYFRLSLTQPPVLFFIFLFLLTLHFSEKLSLGRH